MYMKEMCQAIFGTVYPVLNPRFKAHGDVADEVLR